MKPIFTLTLTAALLGGCASTTPFSGGQDFGENVEEITEDWQDGEKRVERGEKRLKSARKAEKKAEKRIEAHEDDIKDLERDLRRVESRLDAARPVSTASDIRTEDVYGDPVLAELDEARDDIRDDIAKARKRRDGARKDLREAREDIQSAKRDIERGEAEMERAERDYKRLGKSL